SRRAHRSFRQSLWCRMWCLRSPWPDPCLETHENRAVPLEIFYSRSVSRSTRCARTSHHTNQNISNAPAVNKGRERATICSTAAQRIAADMRTRRFLRGYPTSPLQEAFQPLPRTPECSPVASAERLVGLRQRLAWPRCGCLWSLHHPFRGRRLRAEYDLEG